MVSVADSRGPSEPTYREQLEEQARRKGAAPMTSVDELQADVFDSDAELDEFLSDLHAFRHADMA